LKKWILWIELVQKVWIKEGPLRLFLGFCSHDSPAKWLHYFDRVSAELLHFLVENTTL
jgi:hypothetical protein